MSLQEAKDREAYYNNIAKLAQMIKDVSGFLDSRGRFHKTLKEAQEQEATYLLENFYFSLPHTAHNNIAQIQHFILYKEQWDKLYQDYQNMNPKIKIDERKNTFKLW